MTCKNCKADTELSECQCCGDLFCADCLSEVRMHWREGGQELNQEAIACASCADAVVRQAIARARPYASLSIPGDC